MDDFVCIDCFSDYGLRSFVENNASENSCSYCGQHSNDEISVPIEDLLEHFQTSLFREYDDAANCLPYESREGGFLGAPVYDGYDLLEQLEFDLPKDASGKLYEVFEGFLSDRVWCEADPFRLNVGQVVRFSWDRFSDIVKHERRYYFYAPELVDPQDTEILNPADLLKQVLDNAEHEGLVQEVDPGLRLVRVRRKGENGHWTDAANLGPPPVEYAIQPNRMSPAGIVMFYGSDELECALKETADEPGEYSVGEFVTTKSLVLLDLSDLPQIPSIFEEVPDTTMFDPRQMSIFLNQIAYQISLPIAHDSRVHIEYVPTQVVSEFVRTNGTHGDRKIDGIKYESAASPGHASYVLFATQENVKDAAPADEFGLQTTPDIWMELDAASNTEVSADTFNDWQANL